MTNSRKISETLIDFAKPLIETINSNTTEQEVQAGFTIAVAVWNACVLATVRNDNRFLQNLCSLAQSGGNEPEAQKMIDSLIERKNGLFGDDLRGIGDASVTFKKGCLNVKAEARLVDGLAIN